MKPSITLAAALLLPSSAFAATLEVCSGCEYGTLDAAVVDADAGDTVRMGPGDYVLTMPLTSDIVLQGAGPDATTIGCGDEADQHATIDTVEDSYEITVSDLTLERCANDFENNDEHGWAARFAAGTRGTLRNVWLDPVDNDSVVPNDGGLLHTNNATLALINTETLLASDGLPLFLYGDFGDNDDDGNYGGAVLFASASDIQVIGGRYLGETLGQGGCFSIQGGTLSVSGAHFDGCVADYGGALFLDGDGPSALMPVSLDNVRFTDGDADISGGSIDAVNVDLTMLGGEVVGSGAVRGGGVSLYGSEAVFRGTRFADGYATVFDGVLDGQGGGIYAQWSNLALSGVHMHDMVAGSGAGLFMSSWDGTSTLDVQNSLFEDSLALDEEVQEAGITADGAAIAFSGERSSGARTGSVSMVGNTFQNVHSDGYGGAVIIAETTDVFVRGNTFEGTSALSGGGGIKVRHTRPVAIEANLFCDTQATNGFGGAIELYEAGERTSPIIQNHFIRTTSLFGSVIWTPQWDGTQSRAIAFQNNTVLFPANQVGPTITFHEGDQRAFHSNSNIYVSPGNDRFFTDTDFSASSYSQYDAYTATAPGLSSGMQWFNGQTSSFTTQPGIDSGVCEPYVFVGTSADEAVIGKADQSLKPDVWPFPWSRGSMQYTPQGPFTDFDLDDDDLPEDCAPFDDTIHTGATEVCGDGLDQDCDGSDLAPSTWYLDADGDGAGNANASVDLCDAPDDFVSSAGDCDDTDPNAVSLRQFWQDSDGDGLGDPNNAVEACQAPDNYVDNADDCDDGDESLPADFFEDADEDGFGRLVSSALGSACTLEAKQSFDATDCRDDDKQVFPGAPEACNGVDDDCDGETDEDVLNTYYEDTDEDEFGDPGATLQACQQPAGFVADATDCAPSDGTVHPGADEQCNGVDDNCNEETDEGLLETFYEDTDDDGFGDPSNSEEACSPRAGFVPDDSDCAPDDDAINPGATEACNGADDNCNGDIDEGLELAVYYRDDDSDGFGDLNDPGTEACEQPDSHSDKAGDCNDANADVHPDAEETCNGEDNNCDNDLSLGAVDGQPMYPDGDGDGFGDASAAPEQLCEGDPGVVADNTDCDDANGSVFPRDDGEGGLTCGPPIDPPIEVEQVLLLNGGCSSTPNAPNPGWLLALAALFHRRRRAEG